MLNTIGTTAKFVITLVLVSPITLANSIIYHPSTLTAQLPSVSSSGTSGSNPSPSPTPDPKRDELEIEKLEAEIAKLRREEQSINFNLWFQGGAVFVALVAAFISLWSASQSHKNQIQSLANQVQQQQKQHISDLLRELGSEHQAVKIAAIQALSEYESAAPFLVNMLKVASEYPVVTATITALQRMPEVSLPLLIQANKELHEFHFSLGGEFLVLGETKEEVINILSLSNEKFTLWLDSTPGQHIQQTARIRFRALLASKDIMAIENEKKKLMISWQHLIIAEDAIAKALGNVIASASKLSKTFNISNASLKNVILESIDLTGWNFENSDLQNTNLKKSVCKNTKFSGVNLSQACFNDSDLHDAVFDKVTFDNTDFSKARLIRASFQDCEGRRTKFFGAKLDQANISNSKFPGAFFENCYPTKIKFQQSILNGAKFTKSVCNDSVFSNMELHGTEFVDVKMHRVRFIATEFVGVNFSKSDFKEAIFERVTFQSISNFQDSSFIKTIWKNITFKGETNGFKEHAYTDSSQGG